MTKDSLLLAKENTNTAIERNKKYTIYNRDSKNKWVYHTKHFSRGWDTNNIYHTIQAMKQNDIKLGRVLTIDSIGDLSFVEDWFEYEVSGSKISYHFFL